MLADPQFVVHSAATLTDLLSIPLVPGEGHSLARRPLASLCMLSSAGGAVARSWPRGDFQPPPTEAHPSTASAHPCPLSELDLRPFAKLTSLLGMLRCSDVQLARVLRRLPRGLESLCLTAEVEGPAGPGFPPPPAGPPRDFDAGGRGGAE